MLRVGHLRGVFYGTMSTFVRKALEGSEGGAYKEDCLPWGMKLLRGKVLLSSSV